MPLGPNVVLTASAIALAAAMLLDCAPLPFSLFVPSLKIRTGDDCASIYIFFRFEGG